MKKIFFLLSLVLTACTTTPPEVPIEEPETYTPQTVEASLDEPISIRMTDTLVYEDYSLTITNIQDDRCPKDQECYWQGALLFSGKVTDPEGIVTEIEWYLLMSPDVTVTYRVKGEEEWISGPTPLGEVQVSFTDIDPRENTITPVEEYIFTVSIDL